MRFIMLLLAASVCNATSERQLFLQSKRNSVDCLSKRLDLRSKVATTPVTNDMNRCTAGCSTRAIPRRLVAKIPRGGASAKVSAEVAEATPLPAKPSTAELCAKVLGLCVTVGSFTLKLPQIYQCVHAQSVEGLSLWSHYFELNMYLGSIMYHHLHRYPLSVWAENLSLVAQQLALLNLFWFLGPTPPPSHVAAFLFAETIFIGGLLHLPKQFWPVLLLTNGLLNVMSSVTQLWVNYEHKSIGQQSWITLDLAFAGNCARIFTTLPREPFDTRLLLHLFRPTKKVLARGDSVLLAMFVLGGSLSFARVVQYWLYM